MLGRPLSSSGAAAAFLIAATATNAVAQPLVVPLEVQLEVVGGGETVVEVIAERPAVAEDHRRAGGGEAAAMGAPSDEDRRTTRAGIAPGRVEFPLADGLWRLHARADGFWSPPRQLWRKDDGEPAATTLTLWPTGTLTGAVTTPPGTPVPDRLTLGFQATPPADGPVPGSVDCPLVEGRFRCRVPAGRLDLRLRARSFVSHYRWGAELTAGGTLDIGGLELQPGASLVGWVETADGTSFEERRPQLILRARLTPPAGGEDDPSRSRLLRLVTRATERGFFHFEGLAPGRYQIYAKLDGYATAEAEVDIYEQAESTLLEPLTLGPPRTLEVEITPALDPTGLPWRLTLTRWQDRRAIGEVEAVASPEGRWRQEGLPEGDYSVNLTDADGARRLHRRFTVGVGSPLLTLEVPTVWVHGSVRLGDEGLAARVIFGGPYGAESVTIATDAAGDYAGTLPRAGRWAVSLEADEPAVRREIEMLVDERQAADEPGARVDFELPATRLAGRVVDREGRPVDRAFVTVRRPGQREMIRRAVAADGGFELRGLPAGRLEAQAEGPGGNSRTVEVDLIEDRVTPDLLLILEPDLAARVEVLSVAGPVPGARVLALPDVPNALSPIVTTGVDGQASLRNLPGSTREVTLAAFAPGFAVRLFRVPVRLGEVIPIAIDQLGGSLAVELATGAGGDSALFLARDGARIGWQALLALAENQRTLGDAGVRTILPALEAGDYALCEAAAGEHLTTTVPLRCVDGRLDPLGHLELRLEVPEASGAGSTGS